MSRRGLGWKGLALAGGLSAANTGFAGTHPAYASRAPSEQGWSSSTPEHSVPGVEHEKTPIARDVRIVVHMAPARGGGRPREYLEVLYRGESALRFPVSTAVRTSVLGADGKIRWPRTPVGTFPLQRAVVDEHSLKSGTPMPWALYFGDSPATPFAVHGITAPAEIAKLGHPASSGCVRLRPDHAKAVFDFVMRHGGVHRAEVEVRSGT